MEFFSSNETLESPELLALGQALVGRLSDALGRHRAQDALRDANQALEIRVRERTSDLQRAVASLDASQIEEGTAFASIPHAISGLLRKWIAQG